jgi:hypothetical protein
LTEISQLPAITTPAAGDLIPVVDVTAGTPNPAGTLKVMTLGQLMGAAVSLGLGSAAAQPASAFGAVFSPLTFGAAGNGVTDDTTAVLACCAAAQAAGGLVDLGGLVYKTSSPVTITTNFSMRGNGQNALGYNTSGGIIINSASDLFTMAATHANTVKFQGCTFVSGVGGGHIWDASNAPAMSGWQILGCTLQQNNPGKSIWYQVGGGWIDCLVDENCFMSCAGARHDTGCGTTAGSTTVTDTHAVSGDAGLPVAGIGIPAGTTVSAVSAGAGYTLSAAATATASGLSFYVGGPTVPPWYCYKVAGSSFNSVVFRRMRCTANYANAVPFFSIDMGPATGWGQNVVFDSITFELCVGGAIYVTGLCQVTLNQCVHWDSACLVSCYSFQTSADGYPCRDIVIRQCGNIGGTGNGAYDIAVGAGCTNILLETCGVWGTPATYSSPAGQTTVLNPTVGGSSTIPVTTFPGPVAVTSTAGASAGGRYIGCTTGGAPVSGTFVTGDFCNDVNANIFSCTAGGTPGAWANVASASGYALVNDPNQVGYAATYITPTSVSSAALGAVMTAGYNKIKAGGYSISHWSFVVAVSSGNISVGAYTNGGSGASRQPTGGQLATSGAVACPAAGLVTVSLGSTITPALGDWAAISCDNTTATFTQQTGSNTVLCDSIAWYQASRTDTGLGGTTAGSTTVTDTAAVTADLGKGIYNAANIPAGATISAVSAGVGYTISAAATGTASAVTFIIGPHPLPATPASFIPALFSNVLMKGS